MFLEATQQPKLDQLIAYVDDHLTCRNSQSRAALMQKNLRAEAMWSMPLKVRKVMLPPRRDSRRFGVSTLLAGRPERSERVRAKVHGFADPWLVGAVALGAAVTYGGITLITRAGPPAWLQNLTDEVFGAATHFAALSIVFFFWNGLSGEWALKDLVVPVFMVLVAIATCDSRAPVEAGQATPIAAAETGGDAWNLDVVIQDPVDGAQVDEVTVVSGTAGQLIPKNNQLWLMRRWGTEQREWYPLERINLVSVDGGEDTNGRC